MPIPDTLVDPRKDYYATLGVAKDATPEQVKRAKKRLLVKYHPDRKGGNEETYKDVQYAADILLDRETREYYDRIRAEYAAGGKGWTRTEASNPEDPFADIRTRHLRDFIIDSLGIFQTRMKMWIPETVLGDFDTAVSFVYETWDALKSGRVEKQDVVCLRFGAFQVNRRHIVEIQNQLTQGEKDV